MADAGLSHVPGFQDPTAKLFLSEKGRKSFAKVRDALAAGKNTARVQYARVMADMMALRTTAIDTAVRGAIAAGARQLVILGAGYDGRAWRMTELEGVRVFEVDHPATQAAKRERTAKLPPPIGQLTFVPVDFRHDSLDQALTRAGHDTSVPTCWVWEGVVMYLTHEAMLSTLGSLSRRSAVGSTLVLNYHSQGRRWIERVIFRLIGEPMISHWSPAEIAADLRTAHFEVLEDTGIIDWSAKWAGGHGVVRGRAFMRVVVGRREGRSG
jgi:methyltransferase (TIGR00027 family)